MVAIKGDKNAKSKEDETLAIQREGAEEEVPREKLKW